MKFERDFIKKNEGKLTILQIIGFCLLLLGVCVIIISSFISPGPVIPSVISISFFVTMLGFSFAFPALLEGNEGLSTMRIIVFMVTNVICMLLLKIGWAEGIKDLKAIGLDQYWMGLIAFVFGAKAMQTFFESKMGVANIMGKQDEKDGTGTVSSNEDTQVPFGDVEIITEAMKEKGKEWVESFPYVTGLSVRNKITGSKETNNSALIFKVTKKVEKMNFGSIPDYLVYTSKSGVKYKLPTDVIEEKVTTGSEGRIKRDSMPFPLGNSVSRKNDFSTGSIGLLVKKINEPNTDYIVSCYHVFCAPELANNNKTFKDDGNNAPIMAASEEDDGTNLIGNVVEGVMNIDYDFAVARVKNGIKIENGSSTLKVTPASFGFVFPENQGDSLTLCGRTSGISHGTIKSHSASQTVHYSHGRTQYLQGLIEVEKFSEGGDSGGVVINSINSVVGLLIADSPEFSYVLPVKDFLIDNDYTLKLK